MLRNYLKIAFRNLMRRKLFSLINILGLSVGIAFSLLIGVYIIQEKQVNADLKNPDQQFIVKSDWKVKEMGLDITTVAPLPKAMKEEYPHLVSNYYRFNPVTNVVSAGDKHFKENIAIGDTTLVSMYGFPLLHGNTEQAFRDNNSAVITESMAIKLFGKTDVLNERISIAATTGEQQDYLVSAVMKDISKNSVTGLFGETYSVFVPTIGNRYYPGGDPAVSWQSIYEIGLLELRPGVTPASMEKPFEQVLAKYADETTRANLTVKLAPVRDYYLKDNNNAVNRVIVTLSLVALFIISMAVINFININIGTSTYRLKEIGLRKVFGGARSQLVMQYLTEAMVLTLISGFLSVIFYEALRPFFSQVLQTSLLPCWQFSWVQIGFFVLLLLAVGLLAGIYPALVLSAVRISKAVKGKMDDSRGGMILRKSLLVVQFSLAILVFICGLTISSQVSYIFNKDLGYNKEQVLIVTAFPKQWDSTGVGRMMAVREGLKQVPSVKAASLTFEIPDRKPPNAASLQGEGMDQPVLIPALNVDENFGKTLGLNLSAGTFFNDKGAHIPGQVVINESAAKAFGWTAETAIGKTLKLPPSNVLTVKGVVKDFNYSSFNEEIGPLAFFHIEDALSYRFFAIKVVGDDMTAAINSVKSKWKELLPNAPFDYFFMDDKFASLYASELRLKKATSLATVLNLFIVFMGVFGIISFTIARRNREIAVRKVLGADIKSILLLFIKEYAWLILLANVIAWPLAYWFAHQWLQQYVYRVQQNLTPFFVAGLSVFGIAVVLIGLLSMKPATSNPVRNLRAE
ncbi:ABC transporter permease [Terrimonas sp. NA20]|uniref:ABC transporter permease n=1 Tax=Terrimonas ginsenosidimutans TaxID=2908004 RepID=A0ABS9KY05_9BACT|nr:ABC transporter permease [Terrimonas ginsenosidimutans]MCG2617158.1 ABC transporter permease [Terrimonas ginsenosidimutans]